jgi:DNA-binding response OmpR family regulator
MCGPGLVKALVGIGVLVVDEDAETRELLEAVLMYAGALVALAATASEALAMHRRRNTDVMVVSLRSRHDAAELGRELAKAAKPAPVVAIAGPEIAEGVLCEHFAAHVRRPMDPRELCQVIAALARKA